MTGVSDLDGKWQSVFFERIKVKNKLLSSFGQRGQVSIAINVDGLSFQNLNVFASGNLLEVLLLLQGFVHPVVCHTEAPQRGLHRVVCFGKHNELGHVGNAYQLSVQLGG